MTIHFHDHSDDAQTPATACGLSTALPEADELTIDYSSVDCRRCQRSITNRVREVARQVSTGFHNLDELQQAAFLADKLLRHYQAKRKRNEISLAQRDYWKVRAEKIAHRILDITEGRAIDYATLKQPIESCSFTQIKLKADFVRRIEGIVGDVSDSDLQLAINNAKQLAEHCENDGTKEWAPAWRDAVTFVQQELGRRCANDYRKEYAS